ncbi:hypothetical protein [Ideonella sp. BN130291]|uniref:hypothetical protein n=1 Tax=Ideonella sp. BN130291 TaxID=3112940 RepID=UPI002E25E96C|nr:hypothetical protein [Ideonella sp. BN130291]
MNSQITSTFNVPAFAASCVVTLALLAGVFSMAATPDTPAAMATAPMVQAG